MAAAAAAGVTQLKSVDLNFARSEEETLAFWRANDVFKTSVAKSVGRKRYSFFDGPPFATGLPHYGHLLAGTIKDVVCRFAHQTGHYVERRFGWDCHGLPIEFEIEKMLGIKSSHDVKAMGIAAYNAKCREIVMRYATEWEATVERSGRWIDFRNDYKTMNLSFMESVWWVFKQLWEKNLVYRDFRVMPYSTGCTTPLSNFECNMNYKEVSDPSCMVTFPLEEDENTHLIAWTTTPWTLPSNLALCINAEFVYLKVRDAKTSRNYIFAECRLDDVYQNHAKAATPPFTVVEKIVGRELVGLRYKPLFKYFAHMREVGSFRVIAGDFVTSTAGTGVVHCAPGFGEDDFRVCKANNVFPRGGVVCPVDENGRFTRQVTDFEGVYVKDADEKIIAAIKADGRLHNKASIVHSYPYCWRSETPLIYRAVEAWFVNVESLKSRLVETNLESKWVPEFVQTKRFSNWLEDARDWNVSRNRYWGTPLPVWHSDDWEEIVCIGSVEELERLSGVTGITDIHREFVDSITIPSKRPGVKPLKRVEMVFDCWFESGSMPYGQLHYPFENKEVFEQSFPADFIAEGLDQTRGWFYTLLVLSTALFDKSPYKNLVVNGLVLAGDGKKMSKRLKNYPAADEILKNYGADALRLYLINSPVVRAESLRFREEGVRDVVKDVFLPLGNALKFFVENVNSFYLTHQATGEKLSLTGRTTNDMDKWILAATQTLIKYVHTEMAAYRLYTVVPGVLRFVETLTNWYVRMNRRRLKGGETPQEWIESLNTLLQTMFATARILAPFTPFIAEAFFQVLKPLLPAEFQEESIHYLMVPSVDETLFDDQLERAMNRMVTVIDLIRKLRDKVNLGMKMPVQSIVIVHPDGQYIGDLRPLAEYIKREVNSFDITFSTDESEYVNTRLDANFAVLGKKFKKDVKRIVDALATFTPEQVRAFVSTGGGQVLGFDLTMEDVKEVRSFREGISNFETTTDGSVVLLMDTRRDVALIDSWRTREFITRVQRLRKKAGLVITDVVDVAYVADAELVASIARREEQVRETIRAGTVAAAAAAPTAGVIAVDESDIGDLPISVYLVRPSA